MMQSDRSDQERGIGYAIDGPPRIPFRTGAGL